MLDIIIQFAPEMPPKKDPKKDAKDNAVVDEDDPAGVRVVRGQRADLTNWREMVGTVTAPNVLPGIQKICAEGVEATSKGRRILANERFRGWFRDNIRALSSVLDMIADHALWKKIARPWQEKMHALLVEAARRLVALKRFAADEAKSKGLSLAAVFDSVTEKAVIDVEAYARKALVMDTVEEADGESDDGIPIEDLDAEENVFLRIDQARAKTLGLHQGDGEPPRKIARAAAAPAAAAAAAAAGCWHCGEGHPDHTCPHAKPSPAEHRASFMAASRPAGVTAPCRKGTKKGLLGAQTAHDFRKCKC